MERKAQVEKVPAEKWVIRDENGYWQATVLMDDIGGEIAIQSEWGYFQFGWFDPGRGTKTLKEFLIGCDSSYLMTKFMHSYNQAQVSKTTQKNIRERLSVLLMDHWPRLIEFWKWDLNKEGESNASNSN